MPSTIFIRVFLPLKELHITLWWQLGPGSSVCTPFRTSKCISRNQSCRYIVLRWLGMAFPDRFTIEVLIGWLFSVPCHTIASRSKQSSSYRYTRSWYCWWWPWMVFWVDERGRCSCYMLWLDRQNPWDVEMKYCLFWMKQLKIPGVTDCSRQLFNTRIDMASGRLVFKNHQQKCIVLDTVPPVVPVDNANTLL